MAQCYQCGANVEPTDRFCMQCGADYPARSRAAPSAVGIAAPAGPAPEAAASAVLPAPPPAAPVQAAVPTPPPAAAQLALPASTPPLAEQADFPVLPQPTSPTWLPIEANIPASAQPSARPPASGALTFQAQLSGAAAQEASTLNCPRCGSSLPQGARFCGDCGERLSSVSNALPTVAADPPARSPSAVLPDPIPPLVVGPSPRPTTPAPQPVLPPFRASGWAGQPTPDVEIPDTTLTPLSTNRASSASINTPAWGQAAPNGAPARLPSSAFSSPPQPAPWTPGQPQEPGSAGSFQPPFGSAQRAGSAAPFPAPPPGQAAPPHAAFLQAIAAVPPLAPRRQALPRGALIAMIVTAIITLGAAIGGLLILFSSR